MRRVAGQLSRALVVGSIVALMGVGAVGQQAGRVQVEVRVPVAPQPVAAVGRTHLAYEVHVTNFGSDSLLLDRLDAVGPDGTAIGTWSGASLRQRAMLVGGGALAASTEPARLGPGARAVVFVWTTLAGGQAVPQSLGHRLVVSIEGAGQYVVETAPAAITTSRLTPLGAPLSGGPWVAARGPSPRSGHRLSLVALDGVVRVPQRFAVDWVRLDAGGNAFRGEGRSVTDWFGYSEPVQAVADATVAFVRDGMVDTVPRAPAPASTDAVGAPGNVVVLALGDGRFATYAHLKAGSIVVKAGDSVRAGQVLARIGNSGNTGGPHLHFHLSDAIEPLGGEGLPFTLDRFTLAGRLAGLGALLSGTPWTPQASQPARDVAAEMPLDNMVVRFSDNLGSGR